MITLPRLYAIADASSFVTREKLFEFAQGLVEGGVTLLQYRNKAGSPNQTLADAAELKRQLGGRVQLIVNDRADLCIAAEFDGVHVGQDDLSPDGVRRIIGPGLCLGVSTHNPDQLSLADQGPADYVAIGPVFETRSKEKPDPLVGLQGVRKARSLTRKPLVAIGGITRQNAAAVLEMGADAVAVISDLLSDPRKSAEEFLRVLG
ncbi:MAG TPA: thiamine phosphate synthase [Terriglobales bacterium]|nr:thiamine phosphate synthase [Terriglobales bacterium]